MTARAFRFSMLALVLVAGHVSPGFAVTDEEIFRDFRFNFVNPGGRALAMGGAIIADADDATAAQSNPAGLTNLTTPQFFSEIRFADADASSATPSSDFPGSEFNITATTTPDSVTSPSFISYVRPWKSIWLGVSRHEVLNNSNRTLNSAEIFLGDINDVRTGDGSIEVELVNWNVSVGYKPHDRFRLGATFSFGRLDMQSRLVNTYEDPTGGIIGDMFAGVPLEMFVTETDDSDTDVTVSAGLLWNITQKVSVGAVFRQGGDFSLDQTLTAQNIDRNLVPGEITSTVFFNETDTLITDESEVSDPFPNEIHVPDAAGLGVAYQPLDGLTFTLDAVRIGWSDLMDGFNSRLNVLTAGWPTEEEAAFTVDDQTNLHFGAEYEYATAGDTVYLFRGGFHQDKDNRIRADFPNGDFNFGLGNNNIFPAGDDEDHYSLGLGVVMANRFQIDVAGDVSSVSTEAVVSLTVRF